MRVLLMHTDRDFDATQTLPAQSDTIAQDLELATLWDAMAGGDEFLRDVARKATLLSMGNDAATVQHRQQVLSDAIAHPDALRALYALTVEAIEGRHKVWFSVFSNYPSGILRGAVDVMAFYAGMLHKLRAFAEQHDRAFASPGLSALLAMLRAEFDDAYLDRVRQHLKTLEFDGGVCISANLGEGNEGIGYVLRRPPKKSARWRRWLHRGPAQFGFRLHERDEAGARFLGELQDRGVNLVANALAQSCEHVQGFFELLRTELAFYVACLNLREHLIAAQAPCVLPEMAELGTLRFCCSDLRDACLVLKMGAAVVGNAVQADHRGLLVVTGANQGGKSSFLRACGLAQLMMQAGMFVCAQAFAGERRNGLFTHYKREEDSSLNSGKLDEELARLSEIADLIHPGGLLLSNESFASTNEREGSELARQAVEALRKGDIKVVAVTHLFDFAHRLAGQQRPDTLFLRAERRDDGLRTFKLVPGEPLSTSFGQDLYQQVFSAGGATASPSALQESPS